MLGCAGPTYYDYFGVYHNNALYYLPCNVDFWVIKHDLHKNSHRTIPNTEIPNIHDSRGIIIHGLRVGNYFWIFGGHVPNEGEESFSIQYDTSLWIIERELWISGPRLPELIAKNPTFLCATALNSTTVMFIGMRSKKVVTYDFQNNVWKYLSEPAPWKIWARTCSTIQDKQTKT